MKIKTVTTLMFILSMAILQFACTTMDAAKGSSAEKTKVVLTEAEKKYGVQIIGIRRSAANYMLDFRFRILDKDKISMIMDRKVKPELLVEKNGSRLLVPVTSKLGPLRQSGKFAKENKNYFMFFANPAKQVKSGDLVTVTIGDFRKEHIVVQ